MGNMNVIPSPKGEAAAQGDSNFEYSLAAPSLKYDVVVIGGGLSSTMAALRAQSLGKKVVMIQKSWGGTTLGDGSFEVAPQSIEKTKEENAFHPYHYLHPEQLSQAMELLKKWLPLRIQGSYTENHLFLNERGQFKKASFALETQFVDFKAMARKKILVFGVPAFTKVENAVIQPHFLAKEDVNVLPQTLAKRFDHVDHVRKWAQSIKPKNISQYELVLIPPILGLDFAVDMKRECESYLGVPVFELLAGMNSVPGIRFQKALEACLRKAGVTLISGKVISFSKEKKRILSVECISHPEHKSHSEPDFRHSEPDFRHSEPAGRGISIEGSLFILGTGKFISGGLSRDAYHFRETLFNLPLFYKNQKIPKRLNEAPIKMFLAESYKEPQPVFQCGVRVNEPLIPLDEFHEPVYQNLRACGTILQGFDPYQDGTRFGVQMLSGYQAGLINGSI